MTGSAHDTQGRLLKNSPQVIEVLERLQRKIEAHAEEMALVRPDLDPGARCLLISYGVTARAARQAVAKLRTEGLRISFLHIQSLFPIPRKWLESGGRRRGSGFGGRGKLDRPISRRPCALSFRQADLRH